MFNFDLFIKLLLFSCFVFSFGYCNDIKDNELISTLPIPKEKYKILCWLPIPMKSHQRLFEPLIKELANRGHHITLVTPMPLNDPPKNIKQIVVQDHYEALAQVLKNQAFYQMIQPSGLRLSFKNYMRTVFEDPAIKDFLSMEQNFDGIIAETLLTPSFIGLSHKYNAPVIEVFPTPNLHYAYQIVGIPYDTSYIVETLTPYTDRMTFLERLMNTLVSLFSRAAANFIFNPVFEDIMNSYMRYPGWEQRPDMSALLRNISLILINSHFSVSHSYPLPPHAKEIAGINMPPPQPLAKDLGEWMDSASDGVIVFSLGSHINVSSTLGPEKIQIFKKVFSSLKQKILWKWDTDDYTNPPSNVKITKWFPQTDVLGHKNCRLFITHCGFHSSVEAIYHGIPVVGVPVYGDQNKNTKMLTQHGLGVTLSLDNVTEESLSWSIHHVLNNKMFKESAMKRSAIYRDKPESPMDTAVFWTEYVIRHKGAHHLKPAVVWMPWYQQALLDVYAALTIIAVTLLLIIYGLFKLKWKLICFLGRKFMGKKKKD